MGLDILCLNKKNIELFNLLFLVFVFKHIFGDYTLERTGTYMSEVLRITDHILDFDISSELNIIISDI